MGVTNLDSLTLGDDLVVGDDASVAGDLEVTGTITGDSTGDLTGDRLNAAGYITHSSGSSIPTAATAGYAPGCIFVLDTLVAGMCPIWYNGGSATSCAFYPSGPVNGKGIAWGFKQDDVTGSAATAFAYYPGIDMADQIYGDLSETSGTESTLSVAQSSLGIITATATADMSGASAWNVIGLRANCVPAYDIVAAGTRACLTADDATVAITVAGALTTDLVFATYSVSDDADQVLAAAVSAEDTITVTCSADPDVTGKHSLMYVVLRPRGAFAPSHYIFASGSRVAVGDDDATVEVTVTGMVATDLVFVQHQATNDTDTISDVVAGTGSFVITVSADPVTDHTYTYFVLREY